HHRRLARRGPAAPRETAPHGGEAVQRSVRPRLRGLLTYGAAVCAPAQAGAEGGSQRAVRALASSARHGPGGFWRVPGDLSGERSNVLPSDDDVTLQQRPRRRRAAGGREGLLFALPSCAFWNTR